MVNWWFGIRIRCPSVTNPFIKTHLRNPNHQPLPLNPRKLTAGSPTNIDALDIQTPAEKVFGPPKMYTKHQTSDCQKIFGCLGMVFVRCFSMFPAAFFESSGGILWGWDQYRNRRHQNEGSRIDYIFVATWWKNGRMGRPTKNLKRSRQVRL